MQEIRIVDSDKRNARDVIILGAFLIAYGVLMLSATRVKRIAEGIHFGYLDAIRETAKRAEHGD